MQIGAALRRLRSTQNVASTVAKYGAVRVLKAADQVAKEQRLAEKGGRRIYNPAGLVHSWLEAGVEFGSEAPALTQTPYSADEATIEEFERCRRGLVAAAWRELGYAQRDAIHKEVAQLACAQADSGRWLDRVALRGSPRCDVSGRLAYAPRRAYRVVRRVQG